ncbi:hypothetical protein B0H10DRAFT_2232771 [Mycena sp. CBHHK59/15]|nr:hypothetical protein B0H10DRAFT_2232771 [Mycena sp. CBHHK59/15]
MVDWEIGRRFQEPSSAAGRGTVTGTLDTMSWQASRTRIRSHTTTLSTMRTLDNSGTLTEPSSPSVFMSSSVDSRSIHLHFRSPTCAPSSSSLLPPFLIS